LTKPGYRMLQQALASMLETVWQPIIPKLIPTEAE